MLPKSRPILRSTFYQINDLSGAFGSPNGRYEATGPKVGF